MSTDFATVLPEIILAAASMVLLMLGAYFGGDRQARPILWISALLMAAIGVSIAINGVGTTEAFGKLVG